MLQTANPCLMPLKNQIMRQRVNNNEMTVKWIRTKNQLADPFTKAGASSTLLRAVLSNGELGAELFNLVFNQ